MRIFLGLLIIVAALWVGKQVFLEWERVRSRQSEGGAGSPAPAPERSAPESLPGLPPALETSLQTAQRQGAEGLRNWLKAYRSYVTDPRLAAIELDYVVLLGSTNLKEAKKVFAAVKGRTPATSPVYPRIKQLERTYQ